MAGVKGKSGVYKRVKPSWNKGKHIQTNTGRTHFKKGMTPWNQGKKRPNMCGESHPNWKGGITKNSAGYIFIHKPNHPFCDNKGYVREHRLVIEKQIGRYLLPKEIPHHLNEIVDDNRIENFILFKNKGYHNWFHRKGFCNPKGIIFDGRKLKTGKD